MRQATILKKTMLIQNWGDMLLQSFQNLWMGTFAFVPKLVLSIIIFAIGWVFGQLVGKGIEEIITAVKVDNALRSVGFDNFMKKLGWNLNSGRFLGTLFKWFIIIVFLVASLDVVGLSQVNSFLEQVVLLYLPQVIIAVLIMLIAVVLAGAVEKTVITSAKAGNVKASNFLGALSKWAILIFALLTSLYHLGIAGPFLQTLFTGIVVALALAFGLSFGLGGQDAARDFIAKMKKELSDRD